MIIHIFSISAQISNTKLHNWKWLITEPN